MANVGKMIAFVNLKGGVGKSTFAGHMTWWLHEQGKNVALVDTDLQRSSSIWLQPQIAAALGVTVRPKP